MRKKAVLAAALMLTAAMGTTVFAEEVNNGTKEVTATYVQGSSSDIIYSVDVTWGSMEFTYTSPAQGTWNPETHGYVGAEETGRWTYSDGANVVTVTNHSNTAVAAELTYTSAEGYENVQGIFDASEISLETAVGTEVGGAPKGSAALNIAGELPESEESAVVGEITVTLSK